MPVSLAAITFDCSDVAKQSAFWSALLDRPVDDGANQFFASIGYGGEPPAYLFLFVGARAEGKNQVHVDLVDPDYPAEVDRAVGLGAEKVAEISEFGLTWTTLRDPEGNLFDIAGGH